MGLILRHKQARAEYANSLKIYQLQLEGAKVSKRILKNAEAKLRVGTISSMEYAQVSNQYQESITAMLQSANNTLNKKVALETSLGEVK
jgi:outer membrane protein TolC